MEPKRAITQPDGPQTPQLQQWKKTLRSSTGGNFSDIPASSLRRSGSFNNLRKSTGSLAANFSGSMSGKLGRSSNDLEKIESEYIKNLQQQVYFLELEANYLREQSKKATEMHPHMTAEAERMLVKLRQMQNEVDSLHLEAKRTESAVSMANSERERLANTIKSKEDAHGREKRLLLDEVVQMKKEKELLDRENNRKDSQILQARDELDKSASALRSAETKIQMLRNQLDQKIDEQKLTQSALEEKRTELMKTETQFREIEDKYYNSTATIQDKGMEDLRDEIRMLRQKLKEAEMNADQDRYLRSKLSDDSSHLVKENALLSQQVLELQKQLERERSLRESNDTRRSTSITELVLLKDREKQLSYELEQTKETLKREQDRVKHYLEQLAQQEQVNSSNEFNASTTRSKLAEIENIHQRSETENGQLRRDKMLLVDHVADLQKQLDEREKEVLGLRTHMHSMESKVKDLEQLKDLEASIHSQKWDEFSRLAESMKSLSRTMGRTASPLNTARSGQMIDYS